MSDAMQIKWEKVEDGFRAIVGNVGLGATPDRSVWRSGQMKPARGAKWRASVWMFGLPNGESRRIGRDTYMTLVDTPGEAMRLAETVLAETLATSA